MAATSRQVFRARALELYGRGRDRAVLPRFVRPRAFLRLWLLLGALGLLGLLILTIRLPVYASGTAVVVEPGLAGLAPGDGPVVVALLPAEQLAWLEIGQEMTLQAEGSAQAFHVPIVSIEDDLSASDLVERRMHLGPGLSLVANHPLAIAIGRPRPDDEQPSPRVGGIFRVRLRAGSRPVLALLPNPLARGAER